MGTTLRQYVAANPPPSPVTEQYLALAMLGSGWRDRLPLLDDALGAVGATAAAAILTGVRAAASTSPLLDDTYTAWRASRSSAECPRMTPDLIAALVAVGGGLGSENASALLGQLRVEAVPDAAMVAAAVSANDAQAAADAEAAHRVGLEQRLSVGWNAAIEAVYSGTATTIAEAIDVFTGAVEGD